MKLRLWFTLMILFLIYSILVYVYSDQHEQGIRPSGAAYAGWMVWQEHNCHACHQLYGLGGYMGPDLTNIAADEIKGQPAYLKVLIKYGSANMPDFHLSDLEANQLIAFLKWVNDSGHSAVAKESVHWSGTYIF